MSIKRVCDIVCAVIGIIVMSPVLIGITLLVRYKSGSPIFYTQQRLGLNERLFKIYKFRTMFVHDTGREITVANDARITRIGVFLRRYKLDELPQLINVLLGDMSFVGPRPEVPTYLKYYTAEVRRIIFSVRPGITDIASVNLYNESELLAQSTQPELLYINSILPEKLALSSSYIKHKHWYSDILVVLITVKHILTTTHSRKT